MTTPLSRRILGAGNKRSTLAVGTLALLAAAQVVALLLRTSRADGPPQAVAVGADLSSVTIRQRGGGVPLGSGRPTLLLAFDMDCAHSRRIAPEWSAWLAAARLDGVSVVAVAPGRLSEAVSYAAEVAWPVQVGSVEPGPSLRRGALTQRTPWVFAVDGAGRVVAEGHGSTIREVARALGVSASDRPAG